MGERVKLFSVLVKTGKEEERGGEDDTGQYDTGRGHTRNKRDLKKAF